MTAVLPPQDPHLPLPVGEVIRRLKVGQAYRVTALHADFPDGLDNVTPTRTVVGRFLTVLFGEVVFGLDGRRTAEFPQDAILALDEVTL